MLTFFQISVVNRLFCTLTPSKTPSTISEIMSKVKAIRRARYDGRTKKRQWEDRRSDSEQLTTKNDQSKKTKLEVTEGGANNESTTIIDKIKRRKFSILLGYSGVDFYGMQRNPNTKTIEEELFKAFLTTNFINEECYKQVQNMQFQRAARTDKGVSAARQVVSCKLPENFDFKIVNEQLPEVIRIFGVKRVTKGFNSKSQCDGRTYCYTLPTVAFAPFDETVKQEEYRVTPTILEKVNRVLGMFVGTKNFHNFTAKKKATDPSAKRYVKSFVCEEPFVRKNVEFAVLKVYGQSFMLHQIRKMVGLTLAIIRNQATEEVLTQAFNLERINIPRAPGLGLVLDFVHYDRYNYRYGEDGMHEKLIWDELDDAVNDFREKYIHPTIIDTEINEENMVSWLSNKLSRHTYEDVGDDKLDDDDSDGEVDGADDDDTDGKIISQNVSSV